MGKRGNEASLERPRVSVLFLIGRKITFKEMEIRRIVKTKFKTRINVSLLKDIAYIYVYISRRRVDQRLAINATLFSEAIAGSLSRHSPATATDNVLSSLSRCCRYEIRRISLYLTVKNTVR